MKKNSKQPDQKEFDKKLSLIEKSLNHFQHVVPIETVVDTFAGSGTTIIAAEQTDRTAFCIEVEPRYCDVIRKRWAEFVHGEGCDWEELTPEVL